MTIRYAVCQTLAGLTVAGVSFALFARLLNSPEAVSAVDAYEISGFGGANLAAKSPVRESFEFQRGFAGYAYDFDSGRKLPDPETGTFFKDPFVNPQNDGVPFFVPVSDLKKLEELRQWMVGVKTLLEKMKVTGYAGSSVFLSDGVGSYWASPEKPLKLNVPEHLREILAAEAPGSVSTGKLLIIPKSSGNGAAVFSIPFIGEDVGCAYEPSERARGAVFAGENPGND